MCHRLSQAGLTFKGALACNNVLAEYLNGQSNSYCYCCWCECFCCCCCSFDVAVNAVTENIVDVVVVVNMDCRCYTDCNKRNKQLPDVVLLPSVGVVADGFCVFVFLFRNPNILILTIMSVSSFCSVTDPVMSAIAVEGTTLT